MQDRDTIKNQAEAMEIDPFHFVCRLLELKEQELELKDQECQRLRDKITKYIYDENKGD